MREVPQARGDPCRDQFCFCSLSLHCEVASACGEGWPICRLPRAFCRCLSTYQFGKLQALLATVFANYNEGYFPLWFRPRPCPKPKRVLANWNMVRHVLRIMTVELRHAVHLLLKLAWLRLFRGEGGPPRFQHLATRDLSRAEPLHNISWISESILLSSNVRDRAES